MPEQQQKSAIGTGTKQQIYKKIIENNKAAPQKVKSNNNNNKNCK